MSKTPVPVLTKKQQKLSLSAKKTKTKQTIRNVLASPHSKYWPLISNGNYQILKNALDVRLPKLLPEKVNVPFKELKAVPKSSRKAFRQKYIAEHSDDSKSLREDEKCISEHPDDSKYLREDEKYISEHSYSKSHCEDEKNREGLVLGVNDVTRALESQEAKSVLITADVLPQLMVEHVIDQSVLLGLPVLVVPSLRTILKEKCGISSVAVAFTGSPKYKLIQAIIEDISRKYPVPESHVHFDRSRKVLNSSVIVIDDSIMEDVSKTDVDDKVTKDIGTKKVTDESVVIIEDSTMEDSPEQRREKPENSATEKKSPSTKDIGTKKVTDESVIIIEDSATEDSPQERREKPENSVTEKKSEIRALDTKNTSRSIECKNAIGQDKISESVIVVEDNSFMEDTLKAMDTPEKLGKGSKNNTDITIAQKSTNESDALIKKVSKTNGDGTKKLQDNTKETSTENFMDTTNKVEDEAMNDSVEKVVKESDMKNEEPVKNIHLARKNKDRRVFIPGQGPPKMDVDSSGFLAFSNDPTPKKKVRKEYASLKVLRIKGDTNRNKRKIQAMKEKIKKNKGIKSKKITSKNNN